MTWGQTCFDTAVSYLEKNTANDLKQLSADIKFAAQEIRLIEGYSPQIMLNNRLLDSNCGIITKQTLNECLISLCKGSVHTYQKELAAGFLSIEGGHRVGFAATAVYDLNGNISAFRDITAIVIRIAKSFNGISLPLINKAFYDGLCGLIIAGAPSSGKTTLLKDMAYQLSDGIVKGCDRVAVIDERGELGSCGKSLILKGYDKVKGILMALRVLSPQIILCDEIGEFEEAKAVKQALNSGVYVITTVHAASKSQLLQRTVSAELISSKAFKRAVILTDKPQLCSIKEVFDIEHAVKTDRNSFDNDKLYGDRNNQSSLMPFTHICT